MPQRKDVELLLTGYVEGSRKSRSISTLSGKLSELETLAYDPIGLRARMRVRSERVRPAVGEVMIVEDLEELVRR